MALGCGSGWICWRRLRDWQAAGVWEKVHERVLNWLGDQAVIDWSRASLDSISVRAKRGASRPARPRSTGANAASSTTWWWIGTASPWPSGSRRPTPTTRPSSSRWSMPSPQSLLHAANPADPGSARPSSMPTRATTTPSYAVRSVPAASPHASHDAASTRASGLAGIAGWSGRRRGCCGAVGWECATSDAPTCSGGYSTWPAPCSVCASSPRGLADRAGTRSVRQAKAERALSDLRLPHRRVADAPA